MKSSMSEQRSEDLLPIKQLFIITILISVITMGPFYPQHHSTKAMNDCQRNEVETKEQIKKIQSKEDVIKYLGKDYKEVKGEMYNNTVWRFDICSTTDYQFDLDYDIVDTSALVAGDVKQLVFISFAGDDKTIISKTFYYLDHKKNIHAVKFFDTEIQDNIFY